MLLSFLDKKLERERLRLLLNPEARFCYRNDELNEKNELNDFSLVGLLTSYME